VTDTNCAWFSDHIAMTSVDDIEIRALMPASFDDEAIAAIVQKINQIKSVINKPFLLENITYYYSMPSSHLKESYFINEIVRLSDCGLLLDINNLYVNAVNHQYDPYEFLNEIPLDHVVEVHLAGCEYMYDMLIDSHASTIKKEVLMLFEYLCQKIKINGVIIERDDRLDHFEELLNEIDVVRKILDRNS